MKPLALKSFENLQKHRNLKEHWIYCSALLWCVSNQEQVDWSVKDQVHNAVREFNTQNHTLGSATQALNSLQNTILRLLKKESGLILPDYYQSQWMSYGTFLFGVPLGLVLAFGLDNWSLVLLGFPAGLLSGFFIGRQKDKKAAASDAQILLSKGKEAAMALLNK